jgi:hypothetical protein
MDKRIKELAEQAGFQNSGGVGFIGMERFLTQFAELVRQDERELAKPEQEPVGRFIYDVSSNTWVQDYSNMIGQPLYTAPPRKEWVGLTGTEINHIFAANVEYPERMCHAIEAALKDKNNAV